MYASYVMLLFCRSDGNIMVRNKQKEHTKRKSHNYLIITNSAEIQFSHQVLQLQNQINCLQVTFICILLQAHTHTGNGLNSVTRGPKI